jgi:predicted dinucleotide-binding enzyme
VKGLSVKIVVVGRGHVGGGLARLWSSRGHQVTALGRGGGDATDAEVIVIAVAAEQISDALDTVVGLAGQPTIDACNIYTDRQTEFRSLSHQIQSIIGGPTAKAFLHQLRQRLRSDRRASRSPILTTVNPSLTHVLIRSWSAHNASHT